MSDRDLLAEALAGVRGLFDTADQKAADANQAYQAGWGDLGREMQSYQNREGMPYGPSPLREELQHKLQADPITKMMIMALGTGNIGGKASALSKGKPAWSEWWRGQFDENANRYLPDDYFQPMAVREPSKSSSVWREYPDYSIRMTDNGFFEAVADGKVVGIADNGAIEVAPQYQKRGIGTELLRAVKERNPDHKIGNHTPAGKNLALSYFDKYVSGDDMAAALSGGKLPMDEASRTARAKEMGFDTDTTLYHSTNKDVKGFDPAFIGSQTWTPASAPQAFWLAKDPELAARYARGEGQNIMPVFIKKGSAVLENDRVVAVSDPTAIRSKFANFDPAKKDSSDLLASMAAALAGGGAAVGMTQEGPY